MSKRDLVENEYYHIYSRGVLKNNLFLCHDDYLRFMCLIKISNNKNCDLLCRILKDKSYEEILEENNINSDFVEILTGVLMPNHFHILIKAKGKNLTGKFMHKVLTGYAMYFNRKYSKIGHTFERKYQFRHIKNDSDLKNVIHYIKMNPLKLIMNDYSHKKLMYGEIKLTKKQKKFIEKYPYKLG